MCQTFCILFRARLQNKPIRGAKNVADPGIISKRLLLKNINRSTEKLYRRLYFKKLVCDNWSWKWNLMIAVNAVAHKVPTIIKHKPQHNNLHQSNETASNKRNRCHTLIGTGSADCIISCFTSESSVSSLIFSFRDDILRFFTFADSLCWKEAKCTVCDFWQPGNQSGRLYVASWENPTTGAHFQKQWVS